ncbi:MAG: exo-alpha-sialidase, partial [Candidatus Zixiibacteriota bacterium]
MSKLLYIIAPILFLATAASAQWTEPMRISHGFGLLDPQAVVIGDTIHVVAYNNDLIYMRSEDNGNTWTYPAILFDTTYVSLSIPGIAYGNNKIHLTWVAWMQETSPRQIYHSCSSDGGRTWGEWSQVFNNSSSLIAYPRIAVNGDTLFLSCKMSPDLLTFRSFDSGISWRDSTVVENDQSGIFQPPYIFFTQDRLHLIYQLEILDDSLGVEIYHRFSDDYGLTWNDRLPLSTVEQHPYNIVSQAPSACVGLDGTIMALWSDWKYGGWDILIRVSLDNGLSWLPESRVTYGHHGLCSSCVIIDSVLYAVWEDALPGNFLYFKIMSSVSHDRGLSWAEPDVISGPAEMNDYTPALLFNTSEGYSTFHCVFRRVVLGQGSDLFYIRKIQSTGIQEDGGNVVHGFASLIAYPNPF